MSAMRPSRCSLASVSTCHDPVQLRFSRSIPRLEGRLRGVPFSSGFRPFHPFEAEARTLRTFEHTIIPGLFQTRDYARVMMEGYPEITELEVTDRVEGRMARQAILTREDPPRGWAVLDHQVLTRNIGAAAVMFGQMEHLAELARRPRITIQVIPADRPHPGLLRAFVIAETGAGPGYRVPGERGLVRRFRRLRRLMSRLRDRRPAHRSHLG
jgi:hypothetical protein